MDGMGRHLFSRWGDIVTPIRYYSPAERLRLIALLRPLLPNLKADS